MTSLTFVTMSRQFHAMFLLALNDPYLHYTLFIDAKGTSAHKCNYLFLVLHKIHSQVRTQTRHAQS